MGLFQFSTSTPPRLDLPSDDEDLKEIPVHELVKTSKRRKLSAKKWKANPAEVICLSDDTAEEPDSDVSPTRVSKPQLPADAAQSLEQAAADARRVARPAAGQHPILERNRRALEQLQRAAVEKPVDLISSSEEEERPSAAQAAPAESREAQASPPRDEPKVRVTVVCDRGRLAVQLAPTKPLQILFDAFRCHAEKQLWAQPGSKMRFCNYDGDPLKGSDTLAELDYEDDDRIDVVM